MGGGHVAKYACTWTPFNRSVERMVPARKPNIRPCLNLDSRAVAGRDRHGVSKLTIWFLRHWGLQGWGDLCPQSVSLLSLHSFLWSWAITFPLNWMARSHQGVCLYADVNHFFLCPLLAAAHRMEVILTPCSIDVGYFYDIIFSHALIPIKFSNLQWAGRYPRIKAQSWYLRKMLMGADAGYLKRFATIHHS